MQNKKIIFMLMLCVGMQSSVSFGMQKSSQSLSYWQKFQQWFNKWQQKEEDVTQKGYNYASPSSFDIPPVVVLGGVASKTVVPALGSYGAITSAATGAGIAAAGGLAAIKGSQMALSGIAQGSIASTLSGSAALSAGLAAGLYGARRGTGGVITNEELSGIMYVGVGLAGVGLVSAILHNLYDTFIRGEVTESEAVNRTENALLVIINDNETYPTVKTKIDALKIPETLLVFKSEEKSIIQQACNRLIKKFESQLESNQEKDQEINAIIEKWNEELKKYSVKEQIEFINNKPDFKAI